MILIPEITYIKNGVEKTIVVTKRNQRKIKKEIYKTTHKIELLNYQIDSTYVIKDDIEFIHFKNISFQRFQKIKSSRNTLCILEDCTFTKSNQYFNNFYLEGGVFELINPNPNSKVRVTTNIISDNDLSVTYTKNSQKEVALDLNEFNNQLHHFVRVTDNENIHQLIIKFFNIHLANHLNLIKLNLFGEHIEIGNSNVETTIKISGPLPSEIIAKETIKLKNCSIEKNKGEGILRIFSPKITVENVTLKSKNTIQINENYYYKKETEEEVTITDKELSRINLITCLKGYKQLLEQQIILETESYLQETYNRQRSQLEHQETIIQEQLLKLEQLKQQLQNEIIGKEQSITRNLSKKPAKYFG